MKIVFMGTGPFAVPTFQSLNNDHEIPVLVTRPTVTVRRGKQPPNPMRDVAVELGIPVLDPPSVNDNEFIKTLSDYAADLLVVCDYGQILSRTCLAAARLGGINLHGSLLPKYRGAAPVNWPIYFGDPTTGVSVIHMTPKLDGGPVLTSASTEIGDDETAAELEPRLSQLGVPCVHEAIALLEDWDGEKIIGQVQDSNLATPARRLNKKDGLIDWTRAANEIRNQIRAFQPWPASYSFWVRNQKPMRLILHRAKVDAASTGRGEPGTAVEVEKDKLVVATGDQNLSIESVQPSGKKLMQIDEFLRGYQMQVGDRFVNES